MAISATLTSGMQTLQASMNRTAIAGSRLNVDDGDLANRMVDMQRGAIDAKAAANVIKTGDEILGTIIDLRG